MCVCVCEEGRCKKGVNKCTDRGNGSVISLTFQEIMFHEPRPNIQPRPKVGHDESEQEFSNKQIC